MVHHLSWHKGRGGGGYPGFLLARFKVKLKVLLSPSPQCSLCTDPPLPHSSQEKSEKGPLVRFFLRGEGFVHRLPQCSVVSLTVSRQTGLKFNHRPSRKVIFYLQPSEMQSNINRQNVSMYFKSHYFSWSSQTFGSWIKNLWTGKTTSRVLKNALSEHYNTLQLSYILKYFEILYVKGRVQGGWIGWLAWLHFRTAHLKKINTRRKTEIRAIAMHANAESSTEV